RRGPRSRGRGCQADVPEPTADEVVRSGLAPAVTGATVTAVRVYDERSLKRHGAPSEDFVQRLTGSTLEEPRRRGKFLWIPITPGRSDTGYAPEALVIHLGMSGQVLLREPDAPIDRLTRISMDVEQPARVRIDFVDQRIFRSMA